MDMEEKKEWFLKEELENKLRRCGHGSSEMASPG